MLTTHRTPMQFYRKEYGQLKIRWVPLGCGLPKDVKGTVDGQDIKRNNITAVQ